jgi:hypothetical protein
MTDAVQRDALAQQVFHHGALPSVIERWSAVPINCRSHALHQWFCLL